MDAPQSRAEIQPVVEGLQRLDPLLDIRWNPTCLLAQFGMYDAQGRPVPPKYEGRWEVVRHQTPHVGGAWYEGNRRGSETIEPAVIYQVREPDDSYKPVGEWLVAFFRQWDSQQAHFAEEVRRRQAEEDRLEEAAMAIDAAGVEDRVHELAFAVKHEGGRSVFFGQGADFADMQQRAARATAPPDGEPAHIPVRPR